MKTPRIALLASIAAACGALAPSAHAAPIADQGVAPLPGPMGCVAGPAVPACQHLHESYFDMLTGIAIAPNGATMLLAAKSGDRVTALKRDATTGTLTPFAGDDGCVASHGDAACQEGHSLNGARAIAISPDSRFAYTVSERADALTTVAIGPNGITQPQQVDACVAELAHDGACQDGHALLGLQRVAMAPDGKNVYATTIANGPHEEGIVGFARNAQSGFPSQLAGASGCLTATGNDSPCGDADGIVGLSDIAVAPDGRQLLAAASDSGAITTFSRAATGHLTQLTAVNACASATGSDGDCLKVPALASARRVTLSPDGRSVYATAGSAYGTTAIVQLRREPATGALAYQGCWGTFAGCAALPGLQLARGVAVSADGAGVYVTAAVGSTPSMVSSGVMAFRRDKANGALTAVAQANGGCVIDVALLGCADGIGLNGATELVIAPDGRHVYAQTDVSIAGLRRHTGAISLVTG